MHLGWKVVEHAWLVSSSSCRPHGPPRVHPTSSLQGTCEVRTCHHPADGTVPGGDLAEVQNPCMETPLWSAAVACSSQHAALTGCIANRRSLFWSPPGPSYRRDVQGCSFVVYKVNRACFGHKLSGGGGRAGVPRVPLGCSPAPSHCCPAKTGVQGAGRLWGQ